EQRSAIAASHERILKRARKRKRLGRYLMQTVLILPAIGLLRLLPVEAASNVGGWIGRRFIAPSLQRETVYRTIRVPFPDMDDTQVRALLTDMGDNLGRVLGEAVHLEAFAGRGNPRLALEGVEHVDAAVAEGRGILLVGGHFANWELFEVALANPGLRRATVLPHPSNP